MFPSSFRLIARTATSAARQYSTRASPRLNTVRNAAVAVSTLAIGGWAVSQRSELRNESSVRESVLDHKSLKEPISKRETAEVGEADAGALVERKVAEAEETPSSSSSNEGAFNEETGEINWDCPCLGGMAHGPCGEQFKAAFSCFVFSEAEPKGMDCVEKFRMMQDCFREHPDVYGEEIDDDAPDGEMSDTAVTQQDVTKVPNSEPPSDSPVLATTQETTHSKGVQKPQPAVN